MSGGSYDYLYLKTVSEIQESYNAKEEFDRMNMALRDLDFPDVAKDGEDILKAIKELNDKLDKLRDVWKAVEWVESCDWGPDSIIEAVDEYRKSK